MSVFLKTLELGMDLDCLAMLHSTEQHIYLTIYSDAIQKSLENEFKKKGIQGSYTSAKKGSCYKWTIVREKSVFSKFKQEAGIFYAYLKARRQIDEEIQEE